IVAHSHGGNVVLEALPQITTPLLFNVLFNESLGKIVTLGTPFMDTMSPILQRIGRNRRFLIALSWTALVWVILTFAGPPLSLHAFVRSLVVAFNFAELTQDSPELEIILTFLDLAIIALVSVAIVYAWPFFSRKTQTAKPHL